MRRMIAAVALAAVAMTMTAREARAQSPDDLKRSLKLMQVEIDRLQRALNATLGEQKMGTYLDWSAQYGDKGQYVVVLGWALACGATEPLAQVMIDGIIADDVALARFERHDVSGVYSGYCTPFGGLTANVGAMFIVDLTNYGPGEHTVQLRIRDLRGFVLTSNPLTSLKTSAAAAAIR